MERPAWAPRSIDISVPSVSRIYDYYLGGSHNFEVDREAARKAMEFMPGLPKIMQANRAFMRRAVRFAADEGIDPVPRHRLRHPHVRQRPRGRADGPARRARRLRRPRPRRRRAQPGGAAGQRRRRRRSPPTSSSPRRSSPAPRPGRTDRPEPAGRPAPRGRTALRGGRGRPVRGGGRAARRARAGQPAASSPTPRTRASRSRRSGPRERSDVYKNIRNPLIMRSRERDRTVLRGV